MSAQRQYKWRFVATIAVDAVLQPVIPLAFGVATFIAYLAGRRCR
jgi:hypothetical protein